MRMVRQSGFSFTEIITGTVILGILGVVALPRITSLQKENSLEAARSIASKIESNSTRNHAIDLAVEEGLTTIATDPFINIKNCKDGEFLLDAGKIFKGYDILPLEVSDQIAATCTLVSADGAHFSFVIIGAIGGVDRS